MEAVNIPTTSSNDKISLPTSSGHMSLARPPFERIALLLQGGGALGAYQAGVYEALAEAHAAGVVHGGLTPDTVMVTPKGNAKILDFGFVGWKKTPTPHKSLPASSRPTAPSRDYSTSTSAANSIFSKPPTSTSRKSPK